MLKDAGNAAFCPSCDQNLNISHAFGNREGYLLNGFGFTVPDGRRAVSVDSSYTVHNGEAETDMSTSEEYRRRSLATAVCARLILECVTRRITLSWDAQNAESVKLGFVLDHAYEAYALENE